jgi:hypothetical protein
LHENKKRKGNVRDRGVDKGGLFFVVVCGKKRGGGRRGRIGLKDKNEDVCMHHRK